MEPKSFLRAGLGTAGILLIPFVAMQFTEEVQWTLSDFIVMGSIIFVTGLLLDLALRKAGKYRLLAAGAVLIGFLWLWAELAVGIFTNWGS
jgi:hypothetical protein